VISRDGTVIGYRCMGRGPGIALVQGSMGTIDNFTQLACELSDDFTVHLPERRGRGISPKVYTETHTVARDVEDLAALSEHAGIRYVFGLSSGGLIALEAVSALPGVERIAVYEPPLFVDGPPVDALERFTRDMANGDTAHALVVAMKASQMGPPILQHVPNWILTPLTNQLLEREAKNAEHGADRYWHDVAPTLQFDFEVIDEASRRWQSYRDVEVPVLLLGGSKSPRYLTRALDALEQILPCVRRVELAALDHGAAWDQHPRQNRRGDPKRVAAELRTFFLGATD